MPATRLRLTAQSFRSFHHYMAYKHAHKDTEKNPHVCMPFNDEIDQLWKGGLVAGEAKGR